ncbi:ROK family protein [Fervidibacillus halotolerans]|uniref:fructokinase n=1 Tax=Fervidibacillus halotolerans TaxID=2980027 RepID=A0A9E8M1E4_9BACI|nr:ROK family protein [Fervidibacillus halotolerans]
MIVKLGSIEAGGTKFVCAVGTESGEIIDWITIPTKTPDETIPEVLAFFQKHEIEAMGIGSFGPIDVKKSSPTYGNILNTPKLPWKNYPFLEKIQEQLQVPTGFTTDVNAAALGEYAYGAAKHTDSCLYITVGTGIGAGAVINGELLEGFSHPEMGHIIIRRHPDDRFEGVCPYHKDCLEGMASGPAIEKRWGKKGIELSERKEVWELEAYYIAQALVQYIMILCPEKIIIGGGVSQQETIFPLVREKVKELLGGYFTQPEVTEQIDDYIVPPGLENNAGIVGGLVLAKMALESK